jgi:hypothetical protein
MKRILAIAGFGAALLWCAPVLATGMFQPDGVSAIDPQGDNGPQKIQLPPDPEGKAVELRLHGQCTQAIPILRTLTYNNSHDDIARYNLGQCLVDVGKASANTQGGLNYEREGVQWMLEAANHGLPNAQAGLVSVYLNGDGVARDPVQAGKWALIYRGNGMRLALGMPDISSGLQARLDSSLNERNWDQAQSLADQWSPDSQSSAEE